MTWHCFIKWTKHVYQADMALNKKYKQKDCLCKRNITSKVNCVSSNES